MFMRNLHLSVTRMLCIYSSQCMHVRKFVSCVHARECGLSASVDHTLSEGPPVKHINYFYL